MAGRKNSPRKRAFDEWQSDFTAISELCTFIRCNAVFGTLTGFCRAKDFRYEDLRKWVFEEPARVRAYEEARKARAELIIQESLEAATQNPGTFTNKMGGSQVDPGDVAHRRLKIEALRWAAQKLDPASFGDKVDVTQRVTVDAAEDLREFLAKRGGSRLEVSGDG